MKNKGMQLIIYCFQGPVLDQNLICSGSKHLMAGNDYRDYRTVLCIHEYTSDIHSSSITAPDPSSILAKYQVIYIAAQ